MKKIFLMSAVVIFIITGASAQQIQKLEVPSLVLNSFQQAFPKSSDVEWEIEADLYKVEFETGWFGPDHHAWFDNTGKLVRQKEEIHEDRLPQNIRTKISSDFSDYKIDDVKKITEGEKTTYTVELETSREELKVAFDADGAMLSKLKE